jgi:hypothetical protein
MRPTDRTARGTARAAAKLSIAERQYRRLLVDTAGSDRRLALD